MVDYQTDWPKISVVIGTLNRVDYLGRLLKRMTTDDYPDFEIVVVDGASTDGTVDFLKTCGHKVRWMSELDNGATAAYNKGILMAQGEIVKIMTDDDLLRHGALRRGAEYFLVHPEIDILFGQTAYWIEREGVFNFEFETHVTDPSQLTLHHWLHQTQGVTTLGVFIRRRLFDRIGLLAEGYVADDVEFFSRAAFQGVKMGLIPDVVADFYLSPRSIEVRRKWKVASDLVRINAKYGTPLDVLVCIWRLYIAHVLARTAHAFGFHPVQTWHKLHGKL